MKKNKILAMLFTILLIAVLSVGLTACGDKEEESVTLSRARIVGSSTAYFEDFDLSSLKIELTYSDGSKKNVPLTASMLSEDSRESLQFLGDGKKTINATYQGKNVSFSLTLTHNPNLPALDGFTFEDKNFVFSGQENNLKVSPNSEDVSIVYINNGKINVGEYDVIAVIKKQGYQTSELTAKLTVTPKLINKPTKPANLIYNKEVQYAAVKPSEYYQVKGETYGRDAGNYRLKVALNNENYRWDDNSSDDLEFVWTIEKQKIDLSGIEWQTDKAEQLYDGNPKSVGLKQYPRTVLPKYSGTKQATEEGEYICYVSYEVQDPLNYEIDKTKPYVGEFRWKIFRNRFNINPDDPNSMKLTSIVVEYDGLPHMIEVSNLVEGATVIYNSTGVTNYKAEPYQIKATISKKGYETAILTATITITKKEISIPRVIQNTYYYNGTEQTVELSNYDGFVVKGIQSGIEPNTFNLSFALADKTNCIWSDGTVDDISNSNTWWRIAKIPLNNSLVSWNYSEPFVFGGDLKQVFLNTEGINGIRVIYQNNEKTNAGNYLAEATIEMQFDRSKYENYDSFVKQYRLNWEIKPYEIDFANIVWDYTSAFIYQGETAADPVFSVALKGLPNVVFLDILDDNNRIPLAYSKASAQKAGTYVASFSLNNNFTTKNLTEDKTTVTWQIIKNEMIGVVFNDKTVIYNSNAQSIEAFCPIDGAIIEYSKGNFIDAGEYQITVTIKKSGYSPYRKTATLTILPRSVEKPQVTLPGNSSEFNGKEQSSGIVRDDNVYAIFGSTEAIGVNNYHVSVELKDKHNYVWADGTTDDVELFWEITKMVFNGADIEWNYTAPFEYNDGLPIGVELINVPDGIIVRYTTTHNNAEISQAINAGTYVTSVIFDLASDEGCYENPDAIRGYIIPALTWEIKPKEIDMQSVKWNYSGSLLYTGELQTVELMYVPKEIINLFSYTGNVQKDAGITYTATVTFDNADNNYKLINKNYADSIQWSIVRNTLDWLYFEDQVVEYTGEVFMPKISFVEGADASQEGINTIFEPATGYADAGVWHFTVRVDKDGYEPKIMSADLIITPKKVKRPTVTLVQNAVYDGLEKSNQITFATDTDKDLCTVRYDKATAAGNYTMAISLNNTEGAQNYIWVDADGASNPSYLDLTYDWTISRALVARPTVEAVREFDYDGSVHTVAVTGGDSSKYIVKGNSHVNAGNYTLTVSLISFNYAWADDQSIDPIRVQWCIKPKVIQKPVLNIAAFTYDGESHYPSVAASEFYDVIGKPEVSIGNYTITVVLKNKQNYVWSDMSTDDLLLNWSINA